MKILSKKQIIMLHEAIINLTGGSAGIRDEGLLDSALNSPFIAFDGEEIYPSIQQKGARLAFNLIKDHAFVDGNKRIGAHAMLVFFELNQIQLKYSQEELYTIILNVASGNADYNDLLNWVIEHQL